MRTLLPAMFLGPSILMVAAVVGRRDKNQTYTIYTHIMTTTMARLTIHL